jgi:hypothetical protein
VNRLERALTRLAGDLQGLDLHARPDSRARVAEILELIQVRGFHRGKDLQAEFARILKSE